MTTQWFTEAVIVASVVGVGIGGLLVTGFLWFVRTFDDWAYYRRERKTNAERWAALAKPYPTRRINIPRRWE